MAVDVGAVRAAEVDEDPVVRVARAKLGMTRARVDIAMRIERDLAIGMASEPDALPRI